MAYETCKERSMQETPTWVVALVCLVILVISIFIEHLIHRLGSWLKKLQKLSLYDALEKIKAELMLLGFISLLLTIVEEYISDLCIPKKVGYSWLPCGPDDENWKKPFYEGTCKEGEVQFATAYAIHQLHVFIFVLALFHVIYCVTTLALGTLKMRAWRAWEDEAKTTEYQDRHDPQRIRYVKDISFVRRHLNCGSNSTVSLWIVSFFRQFFNSVTKVDYQALRDGFITAHLTPQSHTGFDFRNYIRKSLEEDFKVVVEISPFIWIFAVLFLLANTHGWYSFFWLPFIPLIVLLVVGTKLQVIITRMALRIKDREHVVLGKPLVGVGDDLFWFNRPRLLLFLIHFVLFTNAFQIAFFLFSLYKFKPSNCFHKRLDNIIIRLSMGVIVQVLCSYVTLPLYALVTQMGSTTRPIVFGDTVASAIKSWHHSAKKKTRHGSRQPTPFSSRSPTPLGGNSPVHILQGFGGGADDDNRLEPEWAHSSRQQNTDNDQEELEITEEGPISSAQLAPPPATAIGNQQQIEISLSNLSFRRHIN
ncbi:hypothetical protein NMG60_11018613 [Bertholletia excelsa]